MTEYLFNFIQLCYRTRKYSHILNLTTNRNKKLTIHTPKKSYIQLWFIIISLLFYVGCSLPGSNQKTNRIRFTVQNTLRIDQKNVPIVLTLEQLQKVSADFSLNAYSVVTGKSPREAMIPAQADDLDYDGQRDHLVFLLDLQPEETKEISILYDPNVKATFTLEVNKQTRAAIFPELNVFAAIESDLIAYLLKPNGTIVPYGKRREELFSVDSMFQSELDFGQQISPEFRLHFDSNKITLTQNPQALSIDIEKSDRRWVIRDFENQTNYYVRKDGEQLNLFKSIGLSMNDLLDAEKETMVRLMSDEGLIGCGGFALWHKEKNVLIPIPHEGDYVRVLTNGAMRSVVQRILPGWHIGGETYQLTSTTFIYGGNSWIEQHIKFDRSLSSDYAVVVGIPKNGETYDVDADENLLWSWGTDSDGAYPLGTALVYPKTQDSSLIDTESGIMSIILHPDNEGQIKYRSLAIWDGGINGIQTESEFRQHLQKMTTTIENKPIIKFIPPDEKE